MIQRIRDWLLERRISAAHRLCVAYSKRGRKHLARIEWAAMCALIKQRSPGQVRRMEKARGLDTCA